MKTRHKQLVLENKNSAENVTSSYIGAHTEIIGCAIDEVSVQIRNDRVINDQKQ